MAVQDSRLARLANVNFRDQGLTIDAQIARLEDDIRRLKIEFDIFFNGGLKSAPFEAKSRIESANKRLSDDRSLTYAQRFLLNTIVSRYTAYNQVWRRQLRGREEAAPTVSAPARAPQAKTSENFERVFSSGNVKDDVGMVTQVYETLREAKRMCGESADDISFARFQQVLAEQTAALKQRSGCETVAFTVGVENGKVKFKAKGEKC